MSASEVQICNMALLKYGDVSITSLNDDTKQGRACKVLYPLCRDLMLYNHNWNFAVTRKDISAELATTPAFQWSYAYTLPADCMRVLQLYGTEDKWQVESNELLTNKEEEIYIRYIQYVTETGRMNPAFVQCVATLLAAELAVKIRGEKAVAMRLKFLEELDVRWLPDAQRLNAIEGHRDLQTGEQALDQGNFSWQKYGHSGYADITDEIPSDTI